MRNIFIFGFSNKIFISMEIALKLILLEDLITVCSREDNEFFILLVLIKTSYIIEKQ